MGLESTTYISGLVNTNPAANDAKSQGDDHLRLIKATLLNTFPAITGAVTPTHTELNYVDGVTSAIQPQIDSITTTLIPAKGAITGQTWTGTHAFTGATVTVAAPTVGANPVTKTYADSLAFNAALPSQTGNGGKFVTTDGSNASWATIPSAPVGAIISTYLNFGGM